MFGLNVSRFFRDKKKQPIRKANKPQLRVRLQAEHLEDRLAPATISQWNFGITPTPVILNGVRADDGGGPSDLWATNNGPGFLTTLGMTNDYGGHNSVVGDDILLTTGGPGDTTLRVRRPARLLVRLAMGGRRKRRSTARGFRSTPARSDLLACSWPLTGMSPQPAWRTCRFSTPTTTPRRRQRGQLSLVKPAKTAPTTISPRCRGAILARRPPISRSTCLPTRIMTRHSRSAWCPRITRTPAITPPRITRAAIPMAQATGDLATSLFRAL